MNVLLAQMVSVYPGFPAKGQILTSQGSFTSSAETANLSLPETRVSLLETTGLLSNVAKSVIGLLLLFSPFIAKRAVPATRLIQKTLSMGGLRLSPEKAGQLTKLLSDRFTFQTVLKKGIFAIAMLLASSSLYLGIQNKQPSMFVAGIMDLLLGIFGIRFPGNHYLWTAGCLRASVFNAGKGNELANYNQPDHRKEWDVRQLNPFRQRTEDQSYIRNLTGFSKFVMEDMRNSLSFEPWRQFWGNRKDTKTWTSPQPELSEINAQLNLTSWLLATGGLLSGKKWLQMMTIPTFVLADGIYNLLISTRAMQNRQDLDGKLVLVGAPLTLAGLAFQPNLTRKYFFLNGLSMFGGALATIGVLFNGKKHGYMVDTLKLLQQQAIGNPRLQASDILGTLKQDSGLVRKLQKNMGINRFLFFVQTLQQADIAFRNSRLPFAQYLEPIAKSYSH